MAFRQFRSSLPYLSGQYNDEFSVEVKVKVTLPVKNLTADPKTLNLVIDGTQAIALSAVYTDEDVTSAASWKSSNNNIATVDNEGMVTAVAKGTATITASFGGKTVSIKVIVTAEAETDLQTSNEKVSLLIGKLKVVNANGEYEKITKEDITKNIYKAE